MNQIHPQYIKDASAKASLVVLPIAEYNLLIEALEDMDDVRAYDAATAEDDGERVPLSDYIKQRQTRQQNG